MKERIMMLIVVFIHISVLFWGSLTDNMIITYIWHAVTFAAALYYLFKNKKKLSSLKSDLKKNWKFLLIASILTALGYFGANLLIANVFGGETVINEDAVSVSNLVFVSINLIVWAPIVEEIVMRYLYRETIVNKIAFTIISTLFFGLIHSLSFYYPITYILMAGLPYFVIGLYLCIIYNKTDNIFINIIMHALINIIGVVMIFMAI